VIGGGDWALDRLIPDIIRAIGEGHPVRIRSPHAVRPWQHVLEPLSGYLNLSCVLNESSELNGEAFNFGPLAQNNYSVGKLVSSMTEYWDKVRWEDVSAQYGGPYESGLLKLNCDKALHFLQWKATWDFEETVSKTVLWYRHFYEQPEKTIENPGKMIIKKILEEIDLELSNNDRFETKTGSIKIEVVVASEGMNSNFTRFEILDVDDLIIIINDDSYLSNFDGQSLENAVALHVLHCIADCLTQYKLNRTKVIEEDFIPTKNEIFIQLLSMRLIKRLK
jgi:hypothetical protein